MNLFIVGSDPDIPEVVRRVAERAGFAPVDMAALLVEKMGRTSAAFAAEEGDQALADMESHVLQSVARRSGCVVALGMQIEPTPDNVSRMKERGLILWFKKNSDARTYPDRVPVFNQAADYVLAVDDLAPDRKVDAVWDLLWE
jgi:hypothetical protein